MGAHLINGEFQSDKYPTCPRGKVPLSTKDRTAQDLLWIYAQRRRAVDAEFSQDLEAAIKSKGFTPAEPRFVLRELRDYLAEFDEVDAQEDAATYGDDGRDLLFRVLGALESMEADLAKAHAEVGRLSSVVIEVYRHLSTYCGLVSGLTPLKENSGAISTVVRIGDDGHPVVDLGERR